MRLYSSEAVRKKKNQQKNQRKNPPNPLQLSQTLTASVPPNATWLPCVDAFTVLVINAVSFVIKKNNFLPLYLG